MASSDRMRVPSRKSKRRARDQEREGWASEIDGTAATCCATWRDERAADRSNRSVLRPTNCGRSAGTLAFTRDNGWRNRPGSVSLTPRQHSRCVGFLAGSGRRSSFCMRSERMQTYVLRPEFHTLATSPTPTPVQLPQSLKAFDPRGCTFL